jgi:hypothetical protein
MLTATNGLFALTRCVHCGCWHAGACPRVKAVEYHPDGTVKRVEYHEPPPVVELNRSIIPHTTESPVKRLLLATLAALALAGLAHAGGLHHHHHAGTVFRQHTFARGFAPGAVVVPGSSYYVRQQAVFAVPVRQQVLVQQAPVYQQSYAVQQVPVQQAVVQQAAVYQQRSFAVQQAQVYQQPALTAAVDCVPAPVPAPAPAPDYCAPGVGAGLAPGYAPGVGRGVFRQRTVQRTY